MSDQCVVQRLKPGTQPLSVEFLNATGEWGDFESARIFETYAVAEREAKLPEHKAHEPWPVVLEQAAEQTRRHRDFLAAIATAPAPPVDRPRPPARRALMPPRGPVTPHEAYAATAERMGEHD